MNVGNLRELLEDYEDADKLFFTEQPHRGSWPVFSAGQYTADNQGNLWVEVRVHKGSGRMEVPEEVKRELDRY